MTARARTPAEYFTEIQPLIDYAATVAGIGLEKSLVNLVEIDSSQIVLPSRSVAIDSFNTLNVGFRLPATREGK